MKLEVGKRYRTRDGKHVVEIVEDFSPGTEDCLAMAGRKQGRQAFWNRDGTRRLDGKPHDFDLVEEAP